MKRKKWRQALLAFCLMLAALPAGAEETPVCPDCGQVHIGDCSAVFDADNSPKPKETADIQNPDAAGQEDGETDSSEDGTPPAEDETDGAKPPASDGTTQPQAYIGAVSYARLQEAIDAAADEDMILLAQDLLLDQSLIIDGKSVTLTGQEGTVHTLARENLYQGSLVTVTGSGSLTLKGIILDGGAVWAADSPAVNSGMSAQAPLASVSGGTLILQSGTVLQNNDNTKAEKPAAGGVLITEGQLILTGDSAIRQNRTASNAGGVYLDGSVLQMEENAAITGNLAAAGREETLMSCVGGVQAVSASQILLDGKARISGNSGTGGGITLSAQSALKISGQGQISGNRAIVGTLAGQKVHTAGGVSVPTPGAVQIEGAPVIWENFVVSAAGDVLSASNLLYLEPYASAQAAITVTGALEPSAKIGVIRCKIGGDMAFVPVSGPIATFASGVLGTAGQAAFVCDDGGYVLLPDGASLSMQPPAVSYDLTGFVTRGGAPVENAVLSFRKGKEVIASATTQADGGYGVETILPGLYNLETALADGSLIVTSLVQITDQVALLDVALPRENTSSTVEIFTDFPWLVKGLDRMFAPELAVKDHLPAFGMTQKELAIAGTGGSVSLSFIGEIADGTRSEDQQLLKALKSHKTFQQQLFIRMTVQKQVTEPGKTVTTRITQLPQALEIRIPFSASAGQTAQPVAYRVQNGQLTAVTAQKNSDGEYLYWNGSELVLYLRQFSPYAIGWEQAVSVPEPEEPETFEDRQDAFWQDIANQIRLAKGEEKTIVAEAGDFTDMNWRVMSALRDCTTVSLKVRWNDGKNFTIPAGKAQKDNGLVYYSLYRLAEIYTVRPPAQSSSANSAPPSAPAPAPAGPSNSAPSGTPSIASSSIPSSSSVPEQQSSAPPNQPETSRPQEPYSRPENDSPSVPENQEAGHFPVSIGVALAGAGGITALIVGGWAIISHLRRRKIR